MRELTLTSVVVVQNDDGSWVAYDDNHYDGDAESLDVGRGDTRDEALRDFAEAIVNGSLEYRAEDIVFQALKLAAGRSAVDQYRICRQAVIPLRTFTNLGN